MQPTRRLRYTIGQLMAAIAVSAGVLAFLPLVNSPDRLVGVCLAGVLAALVWLYASSFNDAQPYRMPTEAGIWKGYTAPKKLDGSNSGVLLRNKRARDLLGEVKRHSSRPAARRRLEEAERKVRKFPRACRTGPPRSRRT
jgi:hypothetical protein